MTDLATVYALLEADKLIEQVDDNLTIVTEKGLVRAKDILGFLPITDRLLIAMALAGIGNNDKS